MNENNFWKLIEDVRRSEKFYETLTSLLSTSSADGIVGFEDTLRRKLVDG